MTTATSNASKLYQAIADGAAPAHVGKPVFEKDLEIAKTVGVRSLADLFGHPDYGDNSPVRRSLNFGSKKDCGLLPTEVRLRLFELKKALSDVEIQAAVRFKTSNPTPAQMETVPAYKDRLAPMLKAFNITDFSSWVPTTWARFYFEEYDVPMILADQFDTLPMESPTVTVPGALGRLFGLLETDAATFSAQANTQASYTVQAKNNVVHCQITEDLNQDSAPAVLDKLRKEVLLGIARAEERSLLDGDDSVAHMDTDVVAATDFRKAYKGLRKRALDNSANGVVYDHSGAYPTKPLWDALLKRMGKYASEKGDLAWIYGPYVANSLVTGAIPELFTAYAFGSAASNVTGQVPSVYGVKGVESEWVREDLGATGVYAAASTKTWMALVKKSRFQNHLRAATRVWAAPSLPSSDIMLMTAKKRHAFAGTPQSATEKSIVIGINIETV